MRRALPVLLVIGAGCADAEVPAPPLPSPLDVIWAQSIHRGDLIVSVPGTGALADVGQPIEALPGDPPVVDPTVTTLNSETLEQAVAAAYRAGFTNDDLAAGAVTFGLWGAGITRLSSFDYVSFQGAHIRVAVLGGLNTCATGRVVNNLTNYTQQHADLDARDLYTRTQTYLAAHPGPQRVTVVAHSWGGAVAEYLAINLATIEGDLGPLPGATLPYTVAAGVPGQILGYRFLGPGLRDLEQSTADLSLVTYVDEIDRPDDPVHALDPSGDMGGHDYNIELAGQFQGSYGITTTELDCRGAPGPCTP